MWEPCSPAADGNPSGTDGSYVLWCRGGSWEPIMTIQEYLALRRGEHPTIAPLPQRPPAAEVPVTPAGVPPAPAAPAGAAQVASGPEHSCALLTDGSVKCWGVGLNDELGNRSYASSLSPVSALGVSGATQVIAGTRHSWYESRGVVGFRGAGRSTIR